MAHGACAHMDIKSGFPCKVVFMNALSPYMLITLLGMANLQQNEYFWSTKKKQQKAPRSSTHNEMQYLSSFVY